MAFDVAAETIEGTPPGPHTVIVKFESTEAAKAWYGSPAYQAVVGKRLAATDGFRRHLPVHEHARLNPSAGWRHGDLARLHPNRRGGVCVMLLDILRLTVAFGSVGLMVVFWYWLMDSLGTF